MDQSPVPGRPKQFGVTPARRPRRLQGQGHDLQKDVGVPVVGQESAQCLGLHSGVPKTGLLNPVWDRVLFLFMSM